jgi:hypothetical protein
MTRRLAGLLAALTLAAGCHGPKSPEELKKAECEKHPERVLQVKACQRGFTWSPTHWTISVEGGAGVNTRATPATSGEAGDVVLGDDPAAEDQHVVGAVALEGGHDGGEERVVRPRHDREPDRVGVFLHGGGGDHVGRLVEARVDDLEAGVAQGTRDDLGAAVVAVEAGLGDEDACLPFVA